MHTHNVPAEQGISAANDIGSRDMRSRQSCVSILLTSLWPKLATQPYLIDPSNKPCFLSSLTRFRSYSIAFDIRKLFRGARRARHRKSGIEKFNTSVRHQWVCIPKDLWLFLDEAAAEPYANLASACYFSSSADGTLGLTPEVTRAVTG